MTVALLLKVVMLPGAGASRVLKFCIKHCGAASTENFKLAHFQMVINQSSSIGFLPLRGHIACCGLRCCANTSYLIWIGYAKHDLFD
jgi:hypothetical protein